MKKRFPVDKDGFIILEGHIVILPKGKRLKRGSGKVIEIVGNKGLLVEVDSLSQKFYGSKILIKAKKTISLNWKHILHSYKFPVLKELSPNLLFTNAEYKSEELLQQMKVRHKEFYEEYYKYQLETLNFYKKQIIFNGYIDKHKWILEVGDIVIWSDDVAKLYEPKVCQISDVGIHPAYSVFSENWKLGKKVYYRYESDYGILYRFSQEEFNKILRIHNIASTQNFIETVKKHYPKFEYIKAEW